MYAIEFHAKIKNGLIEIPQEYWSRLGRGQGSSDEPVRVILLTSETFATQDKIGEDGIEKLLANPLSIPNFVPMRREDVHERT